MKKLARIVKIEVTGNHALEVWFDDGSHGVWRSSILNRKGPVAQPLHEPAFFAKCDIENGGLVWPNGWDASAEFVREEMERAGALHRGMAAAE